MSDITAEDRINILSKQVEDLQKHIILLQGAMDNIKYIQAAQAEYINSIQFICRPMSQDRETVLEDTTVKLDPYLENYISRAVANIHLR